MFEDSSNIPENTTRVLIQDNVIELNGIRQIFNQGQPDEYRLFDNFNFRIPKGRHFISIMGQSGCGKSQILRLISGLSTPQSGEIKKPECNIPMVFQTYSSFPWMTVEENIALPLKLKGKSWLTAKKEIEPILKKLGLWEHRLKYAKMPALSGGQLQRVSIARCLSSESRILLLDEATGALDIKMKKDIDDLLISLYTELPDPIIINVTHSVEEAVYLSSEIILLQANPCRIYKTIEINEPHETRKTWKNSDSYIRKVQEIETIMNNSL